MIQDARGTDSEYARSECLLTNLVGWAVMGDKVIFSQIGAALHYSWALLRMTK